MIVESLRSLAVPIGDVRTMDGNPRKGDVAAVARSLETFGQRKPIVARVDTGEVIAGNHTLMAARKLGWSEVAVVWVKDDDATAKAFSLADNRTAELGGYDEELLAGLIGEVMEADEALLAATAWTEADLAELIAKTGGGGDDAVQGDVDDVPEEAPSITNPGDVWTLGRHRLVCGDSTDPTVLRTLMGTDVADMVWTDPPYGVSYVGKTADALTIDNDRLDENALGEMLDSVFASLVEVCRPGATWFVTSPPGPLMLVFGQALAKQGIWRQTLTWVKDTIVLGHSDYHYRHEPMFYGWVPGAAHQEPPDRKGDSVWEFDRPKRNREHPTMKPVALIEKCIENHTDRGDVIVDPFGGSGSTLVAAHATGRTANLIELDPRYVDVICLRFARLTGVVPVNQDGVEFPREGS